MAKKMSIREEKALGLRPLHKGQDVKTTLDPLPSASKKVPKDPSSPAKGTTAHDKLIFPTSLMAQLGNISKACAEVGISRAAYQRWYDTDKSFRQDVDDVFDSLSDEVNMSLYKQAIRGNVAAISMYQRESRKGNKALDTMLKQIMLDIKDMVSAKGAKRLTDSEELKQQALLRLQYMTAKSLCNNDFTRALAFQQEINRIAGVGLELADARGAGMITQEMVEVIIRQHAEDNPSPNADKQLENIISRAELKDESYQAIFPNDQLAAKAIKIKQGKTEF